MVMKRYSSSGGFILIEALMLAMILSTAAMLVMRGLQIAHKISTDMAVETAGLYVANGVLAEYEYAINNPQDTNFSPDLSPQTFENMLGSNEKDSDRGMTIVFDVKAKVEGNYVTVVVTPTVNDVKREDLRVTVEKYIVALNPSIDG